MRNKEICLKVNENKSMERGELYELAEKLVETYGRDVVFEEIIKGLPSDDLEFQLKEICRLYDFCSEE